LRNIHADDGAGHAEASERGTEQRGRRLFLFNLVNAVYAQVTIRTEEKSAWGGPELRLGLHEGAWR
jgi:hypothetical protein